MGKNIKLSEVPVGGTATVKEVAGTHVVKKKFMDMGLISGVKVEVRRLAPLGDPMEIVLRGYHLCLRKKEASQVLVEVTNEK